VEPQQHDELVAIMARLASGDPAAVITLYDRFGGRIAAAVWRLLDERNMRLGKCEVEGIVFDCCDEIGRLAPAWSPEGGALPWVWARMRLQNVVDRAVGQRTDSIDDLPPGRLEQALADQPPPARHDDVPLGAVVEHLAPDHTGLRLVLDAFRRAGISTRDRDVLLHHADERCTGNASPAVTLAEVFGMSTVNIRQVVRRTKQKLRALAAADPQFAFLRDLPFLA
jgi:hypothetical protein